MSDWVWRLNGVNKAAITNVEITMASCGCFSWPVMARKSVWVAVTLPRLQQRKHQRERAVDEGAVDEDVYIVEAMPEDGDADSHVKTRERHGPKYAQQREAKREEHVADDPHTDQRGDVGQPFQLLALYTSGLPIPQHQRESRDHDRGENDVHTGRSNDDDNVADRAQDA